MKIFDREPVAILAVVQALLAVAISFGLSITAEQKGLLIAAVGAVLSLIARQVVTPVADPRLDQD